MSREKTHSAGIEKAQNLLEEAQVWLFLQKNAPYGLAATRILVGVAVLGLLLSNFNSRHVLWGAASGWAAPFREASDLSDIISLYSSTPSIFTLQYVVLMLLSVALILGWRTRLVTALLALGLPALVERTDLVGDQSDNITRIGLTLMVFMATNAHWSLDAHRARATAMHGTGNIWQRVWRGHRVFPSWLTNLLHNAALLALAGQIFILYTASALYKVQGDLWQEGTAVYYPLSLPEYSVVPWLNDLIVGNGTVLTVVTYFAVYIQLFFAVGLLHPITRRAALIGVLLMHAGIAIAMALPWFSIAMLAFDAIFVSQRSWKSIELRVQHTYTSLRSRFSQGRVKT